MKQAVLALALAVSPGAVLGVAGGLAGARGHERTSEPSGDAVSAVGAVAMTVSDLDRATEFFASVLSFRRESEVEIFGDELERLCGVFGSRARVAELSLGEERIRLVEFLAPEGRPIPADFRSNDRSFQHIAIVVSDIHAAYRHLRTHKVRHASTGPQTLPAWNPDAGGISAFYFKDPDGHVLEIIHFPVGKGDPRWHAAPRDGVPLPLFLGIDHTAIVVADTERSLAFYRDVLGMRVAGGAENYGTEQEHLNNVFGARLRITTLKAGRGPGVELLEYLAPKGGRGYPADAQANDLIHWHTTLVGADADTLIRRLKGAGAPWISPGLVAAPDGFTELARGIMVRDPDGHAVLIGDTTRPASTSESTAR